MGLANGWVFTTIVMDTAAEAMVFEAEAGHTYLVMASSRDNDQCKAETDGITSWILDLQTLRTVARSYARRGSHQGLSSDEMFK